MKTYIQFITEKGGQAAGGLEVAKTDVKKAIAYAQKLFGEDFEKFGNFEKNYLHVQKLARLGKTQRKDMPVINSDDVKAFQTRLAKGAIDISAPYSKETKDNKDPFPQGLSGSKARSFVEAGLKIHDGDAKDDVVKTRIVKVEVGKLKPIQQQIYLDNPLPQIKSNGFENSAKFYASPKTIFIASKDNFIIDGHHRFLAANLIDPKMQVHVLQIDLPIAKLLPMSLAYGDAIGNKRNL